MNNKTKIITKIIIGILGFTMIAGSVAMNNYNNANNSIKNSKASNNSYDFYSNFGTTTTLIKDYFTKSLKQETKLTKIRIDSLPLHSTLNLDNNPIQVAQEINFDDVIKITFKSSIDEYDQFNWSGFVGSSYLPSVTMKIGVGGCGPIFNTNNIDKTTPFNIIYNLNSLIFDNATTSQGPNCNFSGILGGVYIYSLPLSGMITYNSNTPITVGQVLTFAELDTVKYTPNTDFFGNDTFGWRACDTDYFNNFDIYGCLYNATSNFNITIEPPSIVSSSAISSSTNSSLALSSSSSESSSSSSMQIAQALSTGGTILINNIQSNSSANLASSSSRAVVSSSSFSSSSTQNSSTVEPSATTKIFDPKKLLNNRTKPTFGVLSSADDKAAIEDPYVCAGDIYGAVEYSGDYNNIDVKVNITGKSNYELPVDFDRNNGNYVAKVDYNLVGEDEYNINYKVISKLTNNTLNEGNYRAFITQNCEPKKEILVVQQVKKDELAVVKIEQSVVLARTGGYLNLVNLPLILFVVLLILGCVAPFVFGDSEK